MKKTALSLALLFGVFATPMLAAVDEVTIYPRAVTNLTRARLFWEFTESDPLW